MTRSCGSEDYAWTAEATTVSVIRNVVGFLEHPQTERDQFILRPALPRQLVRTAAAAAAATAAATSVFTVRSLQFRGARFDLHFGVAADAETTDRLEIRLEAVGGATAVFNATNFASEYHIRPIGTRPGGAATDGFEVLLHR